ncbi:MAG TPA: 2OG-Fe(II) oxygenase [Rhizomicrobium sp.]|jgi:hypothetical protein|nr:2OG-Fe(II) oxygenase [Rhizomicrobium sp.]
MPARVSISTTRTVIDSDPESDAAIAEQFARDMTLVLDDLLTPKVQRLLLQHWSQAEFRHRSVDKVGNRLLESPPRAGELMCFLLERAPLIAWIEKVTGCRPITSVYGKVTQLRAGHAHEVYWHNDLNEPHRVLAITINLGTEPYEGGRFEMRRRHSDNTLIHHDHNKPGSALVFAIGKDLLHRVTPVAGGGPRTVFAGWFTGAPTV